MKINRVTEGPTHKGALGSGGALVGEMFAFVLAWWDYIRLRQDWQAHYRFRVRRLPRDLP